MPLARVAKNVKNMKKHYATYDLSKLAKDAGFDEECFGFYNKNLVLAELEYLYSNTELTTEGYFNWITAPELTHLQQWVYEKFKVWVTANRIDNGLFYINKEWYFDCPYKALEYGLLEFLKSKQNDN